MNKWNYGNVNLHRFKSLDTIKKCLPQLKAFNENILLYEKKNVKPVKKILDFKV